MVGVDMSSLAHIDNKKKIYFDSWERTKKWFRWYYIDWKEKIFYTFHWASKEVSIMIGWVFIYLLMVLKSMNLR